MGTDAAPCDTLIRAFYGVLFQHGRCGGFKMNHRCRLLTAFLMSVLMLSFQGPLLAKTFSCGSATPPVRSQVEASTEHEAVCRFVQMHNFKPDPVFSNDRCRADSVIRCKELTEAHLQQLEQNKARDQARDQAIKACRTECMQGFNGDMSKYPSCHLKCR